MHFITPFRNISSGGSLILFFGIIILGTIVSIGIAYFLIYLIAGFQMPSLNDMVSNIQYVRILQIFNQIGVFIVPPFLLAFLIEGRSRAYLSFNKVKPLHVIGTILLIFSISPIVTQLMSWNESMSLPESFKGLEQWMQTEEKSADTIVDWMLSYNDPVSILINTLMIVVLPALGEELVFRAVLIKLFKGIFRNIHVAILVSAIVFSAFHMQFYGFFPRMFLGLLFGYLFLWSGSIWLPVLAHLLNNGTVVLITYLHSSNIIAQSPDEFGKVDSPLLVILSVIITAFLAFWFHRTRK